MFSSNLMIYVLFGRERKWFVDKTSISLLLGIHPREGFKVSPQNRTQWQMALSYNEMRKLEPIKFWHMTSSSSSLWDHPLRSLILALTRKLPLFSSCCYSSNGARGLSFLFWIPLWTPYTILPSSSTALHQLVFPLTKTNAVQSPDGSKKFYIQHWWKNTRAPLQSTAGATFPPGSP